LIQQVLNNNRVFVFGELLASPNVQALAGTEHELHLRLLELFAYGTYSDYHENRSSLPELTPAQRTKLRQLSLVSLASASKVLRYEELMKELQLENVRELEDLVIETIYVGLVLGKLDQLGGVLKVSAVGARDVRPSEVPHLLHRLQHWSQVTQALVQELGTCAETVVSKRQADDQRRKELVERMEALQKQHQEQVASVGNNSGGANMRLDNHGYDDMDIETTASARKTGRGKRSYAAGLFDHHPRNR